MEEKRKYQLIFLFLFLLSFDFLTKYLTHHYIPYYPYGGIPLFEDFLGIKLAICHVTNRGGPWGMVASYHNVLVILRIFAIICLAIHLLFFNENRFRQTPLCMIIAGALGNVFDSFFYGHVVDMIHFDFWGYSFPVFNVADASIFLGVVTLCIHGIFKNMSAKKDEYSSSEFQ